MNNIDNKQKIHLAILKQMVTLATSGFGLVAALAWNNVIQELVNNHIKPYLPLGSSLLSLFLYAIIITVLAVVITYNLLSLIQKLEGPPPEPAKPPQKKLKPKK
jgi:hypothetical protein